MGCALGSLVKISGRSPPKGENTVSRKNAHYGGSILRSITFSFVDQSSKTFLAQRGKGLSLSTDFSIFDLWIRSGDIRDQSQKLSEIAKNFGRFFCPPKFYGGKPSKNCTQVITPGSRHVVWIYICDDIPISSELIDVYTLNFKPNFKFSRLKSFGETLVPVGMCASKAWSISSACKKRFT